MLPNVPRSARLADLGLLLVRLVVGARLVVGTWDNVTAWARMEEFAAFLSGHGFPAPLVSAVVSVAVQFAGGVLVALGLGTRPVGALLAVNFAVALGTVHLPGDDAYEALFPALVILAVAVLLALGGAGRWSLDAGLARRGRA